MKRVYREDGPGSYGFIRFDVVDDEDERSDADDSEAARRRFVEAQRALYVNPTDAKAE
jgi:hypothetical protein